MMSRNFWLKILSIVIAVVFSYYVRSEGNSTIVSFIAPVEIQNVPPSKVIVAPAIRQAQVTLRGPAFLVSRVASSAPVFRVKLAGQLGQKVEISLSSSLLSVPPSVEVLSVEPSLLLLELDDMETKEVKVRVPTIGQLNDGKKLGELRVEPAQVQLKGPARTIETISSVDTLPFDLAEAESQPSQDLRIRTPGGLVRVDPELVNAQVSLAQAPVKAKK